jgi:hypothetical protein
MNHGKICEIQSNFICNNNSLTDYRFSLPFVQRILNSNYSDRLKISAADMLFGKIVKLDKGIFEPLQNHPTQSDVPLSTHMSKLLSLQDNLIKASAKELLRTNLLHQTAAQTLSYTEHLPGSYFLYTTVLEPLQRDYIRIGEVR